MTACAQSTITLAWAPPADNGSPITAYCLERDDGGVGDFTLEYAGPNTSCTVKGLKPGQAYRFRLRADNDVSSGGRRPSMGEGTVVHT